MTYEQNRDRAIGLLAQAADALSNALSDLDLWATCGPETYTKEERSRRRKYDKTLDKLNKHLTKIASCK